MDLDDTTKEKIKEYISGDMFKYHWLSPYIIPIWNNLNLDDVLLNLDLIGKLPNDREKGKVYRELFPTNRGETDIEQVENLMEEFKKSNKTNMEIFVQKCLEILKTY